MDVLLKKARSLVAKNRLAEAFDLLKYGDAHEHYDASYALGTWYLHGRFVEKDLRKAFLYFSKAAKGNVKDAFFELAVCYENGEGTTKNLRKAFEAYLKASVLGDKEAKYQVVRCLYYGIGTQKNIELSRLLFGQHFKTSSTSIKPNVPSKSYSRALVA